MKIIIASSLGIALLVSWNAPKTLFISNKTGAITLLVDERYQGNHWALKDSLQSLTISNNKVFDYGKGKWSMTDKTDLKELLKHTKMIKIGDTAHAEIPLSTKVSLIRLNVGELWVWIKIN